MSCGSATCSSRIAVSVPRFWFSFDPEPWQIAAVIRAARAHFAWLRDRKRQRQALAELDDRLLEDIGLTRRQAEEEANKPFWH
jgi:uncharacterized protein YjiS (DUF1127 family)